MAFAQLTYRESLRDIEACLNSVGSKLYNMGFRGKVSRSTLADANEMRDWRIYADSHRSWFPSPDRCMSALRSAWIWTPARFTWQYPNVYQGTDGKVPDVKILDEIIPEPGAFYVMDCGYIDSLLSGTRVLNSRQAFENAAG